MKPRSCVRNMYAANAAAIAASTSGTAIAAAGTDEPVAASVPIDDCEASGVAAFGELVPNVGGWSVVLGRASVANPLELDDAMTGTMSVGSAASLDEVVRSTGAGSGLGVGVGSGSSVCVSAGGSGVGCGSGCC